MELLVSAARRAAARGAPNVAALCLQRALLQPRALSADTEHSDSLRARLEGSAGLMILTPGVLRCDVRDLGEALSITPSAHIRLLCCSCGPTHQAYD